MRFIQFASKILVALFGTAVLALAQSAPDPPRALELLKKVQSTYRAMRTYSARSTNVMELSDPYVPEKTEMDDTITADSSGRLRIESAGAVGMAVISDGKTLWTYLAPANTYAKLPSDNGEASGAVGVGKFFPGPNSFAEYRSVATNVSEARILRSEKLPVNGSEADCWVVAVNYQFPAMPASYRQETGFQVIEPVMTKTLWVDKAHYLVYQEDSALELTMPGATAPTETRSTVKFESVAVDQPVPPETFTFTPPAGAAEMDLTSYVAITPSMMP